MPRCASPIVHIVEHVAFDFGDSRILRQVFSLRSGPLPKLPNNSYELVDPGKNLVRILWNTLARLHDNGLLGDFNLGPTFKQASYRSPAAIVEVC